MNTPTNVNQPNIPHEVRVFLEGILAEADINPTDENSREAMVNHLYEKLDEYVKNTVVDYMPAEKLEEFTALVQKNPPTEQIEQYLQQAIPGIQDVYTVTFGNFREQYVKAMQQTKGQQTQT